MNLTVLWQIFPEITRKTGKDSRIKWPYSIRHSFSTKRRLRKGSWRGYTYSAGRGTATASGCGSGAWKNLRSGSSPAEVMTCKFGRRRFGTYISILLQAAGAAFISRREVMDQYITGSAIRRLREAKRLTQAELADKIGVGDKAVSKWENGVSQS